jgi:hypothetical protein
LYKNMDSSTPAGVLSHTTLPNYNATLWAGQFNIWLYENCMAIRQSMGREQYCALYDPPEESEFDLGILRGEPLLTLRKSVQHIGGIQNSQQQQPMVFTSLNGLLCKKSDLDLWNIHLDGTGKLTPAQVMQVAAKSFRVLGIATKTMNYPKGFSAAKDPPVIQTQGPVSMVNTGRHEFAVGDWVKIGFPDPTPNGMPELLPGMTRGQTKSKRAAIPLKYTGTDTIISVRSDFKTTGTNINYHDTTPPVDGSLSNAVMDFAMYVIFLRDLYASWTAVGVQMPGVPPVQGGAAAHYNALMGDGAGFPQANVHLRQAPVIGVPPPAVPPPAVPTPMSFKRFMQIGIASAQRIHFIPAAPGALPGAPLDPLNERIGSIPENLIHHLSQALAEDRNMVIGRAMCASKPGQNLDVDLMPSA